WTQRAIDRRRRRARLVGELCRSSPMGMPGVYRQTPAGPHRLPRRGQGRTAAARDETQRAPRLLRVLRAGHHHPLAGELAVAHPGRGDGAKDDLAARLEPRERLVGEPVGIDEGELEGVAVDVADAV